MQANRHEDLKLLYNLFARVNALDKLKVAWNAYIKVPYCIHLE